MKALHELMSEAERTIAEREAISAERGKAKRTFQRAALQSSRDRANGLVKAAYLAVARDGRLVQLHLPGIPPDMPEKRGECDGFSEASRRRLLQFLHLVRRDVALPVMVTLTFPQEVTVSPAEAKACLLAFAKRMRREHKQWCAVWRLEAHPKMSARLGRVHPHFHLLTWGAFYDFARVSEAWNEVVWSVLELDECLDSESSAENDGFGMVKGAKQKHREAGTSCERVRKWEGVVYCAKSYIAKEEEFPMGKAGRVWGWCFRRNLPLSEVERIGLTSTEACAVRMEVEAVMRERKIVSEHLVCTYFEPDPSMFVARLLSRVTHPRLCTPLPVPQIHKS